MNYQQAWEFLDNLQFFKIKLGLDSMTMFLNELGRPQDQLGFIHLAGTNGKGSTAATLLAVLSRAGYRVGLYTSPHLNSVRERFRINDTLISEDEFARHAGRIEAILAGRQITYFEFTTALALLWFAEQQVDLALMEVGLGGRLDATNVIMPLVSVITNVSMDHEAYLGATLADVAAEKAGIVKPGIPVVSAVGQDPADRDNVALSVVERSCRQTLSPLSLYGRDFFVDRDDDNTWSFRGMERSGRCRLRQSIRGLVSTLRGDYQRQNAALALAVVELLQQHGFVTEEAHIRDGLKMVSWPGRLEYFQGHGQNDSLRQYLLDGAHNPAGVASLIRALEDDFDYQHLVLVWAAMADKDLVATLPRIALLAKQLILTRPSGPRSASTALLLDVLPSKQRNKAMCIEPVSAAIRRAVQLAGPDDLICIAGSLYLVGEARSLLLGSIQK